MFKIISAGWKCAEWMEQTILSVTTQTVRDWQMQIMYDGGDDGGEILAQLEHPQIDYVVNDEQCFAVRNQYEGLRLLDPGPEDIIVFLDLDGDRLAHPSVLDNLLTAYSDGRTLLTYGSYQPVPDEGTSPPAIPFPIDVVVSNSYRHYVRQELTPCCFNHLRTMKGKVFNSIPAAQFRWDDGRWYTIGADYAFMMPALERAGGRYKCLSETLLLYNHDNPNADWRVNPDHGCVSDLLNRYPLEPLP